MLDWLADNLALIMFVTMFDVIFCGFPVALVMGGTALVFAAAQSVATKAERAGRRSRAERGL
jgi:TRAP-type mannitol/chloroaromatic compound transport system permease large subunit